MIELPDNIVKRNRLFSDNYIKTNRFKDNDKRLAVCTTVHLGMKHGSGTNLERVFEKKQQAVKFLKELCPHEIKCRGTNLPIPVKTKGYFYIRDGIIGFQYEQDLMWYRLSNAE